MTLALSDAAPAFSLPGTDGRSHALADYEDAAVLVLIQTCNHCPYAQAWEARIGAIQSDYADRGVRVVAINSNDAASHPEDSFPEMVARAAAQGYTFDYLYDEEQSVARALGSERTPEVFVFDAGQRARVPRRRRRQSRRRGRRDALPPRRARCCARRSRPARERDPCGRLHRQVALVTASVTSITYAPVKGMALGHTEEVELELTGVRDNRRFHLITDDGRLVNGKVAGTLVQVAATADRDGTTLTLRFPDGSVLDGDVALGDPVETSFYGRPVAGRLVEGPYSAAITSFAGRPLRLVRVNEPGAGSDRGIAASVSVVSNGTLDRLAREAGEERIDGRRFRMLFEIDGVDPHTEERWLGRRVAFGDAVVCLQAHVGRCAVTTHDPDTGLPDLDTLRILKGYRSEVESEEPLPIGVWGGVEQPGVVRVGDPVEPL